MSDEFEDLLKGWLRERGRADRSTLESLAGNVAALPPRRRRQPSSLAAAAAIIVALGLAAFAIAPRLTSISGQADASMSPDPAAFAGDPRLARCSQELIDVDKVFEMTRARYFPLYFPGWWQGDPELEVDDPALVVIEHPREWPTTGAAPMPGQTRDPTPRFDYQMCIAVGTQGDFVVHKYGPTHFDRIVPVLSADDLARAQHMDPDVLADPANYPVPARLAGCGGITDQVQFVFEARSISDYTRYFPAAGPLPVVTADEMATIVVYRGRNLSQLGRLGTAGPNRHDLCVLLGPDPGHVPPVFINDVDLTGFHVRLDEPSTSEPPPTPIVVQPSFTPEPAPAWVANLAGQLDCDGPLAPLGGEYSYGGSADVFGDNPDAALASFLGPSNPYASLPTTGFTQLRSEPHWASYGYKFEGRLKAIVVFTDTSEYGTGWTVVGLRACDASEFDPATPLTTPVTIWTDAAGNRVSTETIRSENGPAHCGWESAVFLNVGGELYLRDPRNVMAQWTKTHFDTDTTVSRRAVDTGYRSGKWSLWLDPSGDAYLVSKDRTERWPRSTDPFVGCL